MLGSMLGPLCMETTISRTCAAGSGSVNQTAKVGISDLWHEDA